MSRASLLYLISATPQTSLPLLRKGFRPFFLLAAAYAVATVVLWLGVLRGLVPAPAYLDPVAWHAHEMLMGFAVAVIAGFLLTAVGNWTQRETATGPWLGALSLLWLLGRVVMWIPDELPRGVAASVDATFLPALAVTLTRPLIATSNRRNFVMLAILAALFAGNLSFHAEALGLLASGAARRANLLSVELITLLMSVIGGRVIPMFTRNATGDAAIRSNPPLDIATNVALVGLIAVDVLWPDARLASGSVAAAAGLLALLRAAGWGARRALRDPLLWILHAGYGWLVVGLWLRALSDVSGFATGSLATHALTTGAIGTLTLGMMARVSLGHSGRMLVAPRLMTLAFVLITLAAASRVLVPLLAPEAQATALTVAATCWVLAFTIFLLSYVPILTQPRVDGKPG